MIIAIAVAFVVLVLCIRACIRDAFDIEDVAIYGFGSLILTGLIFLGCLICADVAGDCIQESDQEVKLVNTTNIIALKDSAGNSGSFFLGSGYIDDDLYYYYAAETERGYKVDKIKASNCYTRYSDDTPRIEEYKAVGFKNWYDYIYAMPSVSYKVVYIPEGSITNVFEVDLE